jgi:hypothetical protein
VKPHPKDTPAIGPTTMRRLLVSIAAWSLAWKGASLWRAARDGSRPWFGALLVSNTLGILDAVYLFGVSRGRRRSRG